MIRTFDLNINFRIKFIHYLFNNVKFIEYVKNNVASIFQIWGNNKKNITNTKIYQDPTQILKIMNSCNLIVGSTIIFTHFFYNLCLQSIIDNLFNFYLKKTYSISINSQ